MRNGPTSGGFRREGPSSSTGGDRLRYALYSSPRRLWSGIYQGRAELAGEP